MSGQNYIGSKISLISLSDIRYVGILHNINSLESTVALQNVQSFGSEGRKANPSEEIAASDNIFDYVVFRGSDIKDLQVFEAPPSYKPEPVIQHQQMVSPPDNHNNNNMTPPSLNNGYYPVQQQQQQYIPYATASYGNTYWQNNNTTTPSFLNSAQQQPFQQQLPQQLRMPVPENYQQPKNNGKVENNFSIANGCRVRIEQEEKTVAILPSEKEALHTSQEKQEVISIIKEEKDEEGIVDSLAKQVSDLDIKSSTSELSKITQERVYKQQQQQQQQQQRSATRGTTITTTKTTTTSTVRNGGGGFRNDRSNTCEATNYNNTRGGGRHHSSVRRNSNGIVVPRSDFDFASANAKFDKSEIITTAAGENDKNGSIVIPEPEQFYNKEKSFFDDISCESKEYNKGTRGGKYQEECKLNLETFGQTNPSGRQNGKHNRNRGRGRGRNHRGKNDKILQNEGNSDIVRELA